MSTVSSAKSAISAKIATATGITPTDWQGEEEAITASHPALYLHWSGANTERNENIGGSGISYAIQLHFLVFAAVETGSTNGEAQAAGYFDQIRNALTGYVIPSVGQVQPNADSGMDGKTEMCMGVRGGTYLYAQGWSVTTMV